MQVIDSVPEYLKTVEQVAIPHTVAQTLRVRIVDLFRGVEDQPK